MSLVLACPHCQHLQEDPFEILLPNGIDWMKCEACEKPFFFAILECEYCAFESGYSWLAEPLPEALSLKICPACSRPHSCHETSNTSEPGIA